jgi:hypothetical protein
MYFTISNITEISERSGFKSPVGKSLPVNNNILQPRAQKQNPVLHAMQEQTEELLEPKKNLTLSTDRA